MENSAGFSSARNDAFPAGLRVLVVDDDPTWLKILEKMLKKCSYEVTTCCLAREALDLLRERKEGFDIVISDVNMPDMDGFKLLEHVGLEMDLPVIMMSVDGETKRVMKGVQHGACDYLLKPIRMKELRNIWQHVFRKRIHEVRDIECYDGFEEIQLMRNVPEHSDEYLFSGNDIASSKKRKDNENKHDDKDYMDASSVKKARVVWTVELHQKFVKAVNQIGFEKVGPKKILDLMNVPWLTREHVASHLQKYRLYLSRLQKENELKASFGGIKHADPSPKDPTDSVCFQNSVSMQQNDVVNVNYGTSENKALVQNVDSQFHEGDMKERISMPMSEYKRAQSIDTSRSQQCSSSGMALNHSFGSQLDVKYIAFDSNHTVQYPWSRNNPEYQFKRDHKLHLQLENDFNPLPMSGHIQVNDNLEPAPSITLTSLNVGRDKLSHVEVKPSYAKCSNQHFRQAVPLVNAVNLNLLQSESPMENLHFSDSACCTASGLKNFGLYEISLNDIESAAENLLSVKGSAFAPLDEGLFSSVVQGESYPTNFGVQNKDYLDFNDPELIAEVPPHLYDALKFDYEYPCDPVEYSVLDQGLFIA